MMDPLKAFFSSRHIVELMALAVVIAFAALSRPLARALLYPAVKLSKKAGKGGISVLTSAFERPLRVFMILLGFYLALQMVPHIVGAAGEALATRVFRSGIILLAAWGLFSLEDSGRLVAALLVRRFDIQVNTVLMPFISKALRFVTIAVALLIVAQEWNFSVSGLLAGLGLGGLAFALAAQDMLSNVFGGIVILLDKPFSLGDLIKADTIEGTVEDINFRSVKVRTLDQAVVTIPNSSIVNKPIFNFSRMGKRRVNFGVRLNLNTAPETVKTCARKIDALLRSCEGVISDSVVVSFDDFGDRGLLVNISCFTKTADFTEYLSVREKIYFAVLEILRAEQAEIALPGLYVEGSPSEHDA